MIQVCPSISFNIMHQMPHILFVCLPMLHLDGFTHFVFDFVFFKLYFLGLTLIYQRVSHLPVVNVFSSIPTIYLTGGRRLIRPFLW